MSYNVDEDLDKVDNGNVLIVVIFMSVCGLMGCALGMAISQLLF